MVKNRGFINHFNKCFITESFITKKIKQILVKLMCSRKTAPKTPQSIISDIRQQDVVLRCHILMIQFRILSEDLKEKKKEEKQND